MVNSPKFKVGDRHWSKSHIEAHYELHVKIVKDTKIARKVFADKIIEEKDGHLIISMI